MELDKLIIRGAKENNLKNISLEIPRNKMVVMTGLSGSGKTSLAFDTIYAEGQRRYVESLSAYARMFLGGVEKPKPSAVQTKPEIIDPDFVPSPISELKVGRRVEHNRFGPGLITEITGSFPDLKAKISFDEYGEKFIMLKYAKLRIEK